MQSQNIYYQEEKRYVGVRLIVLLIITFLGFILFEQVNTEAVSEIFLAKILLMVVLLISMSHYLFITRYPNILVKYRKVLLIFLDLVVLTFFIVILERNGLFLLPLYIIIVMQNGLIFGIGYFYISIISAAVSWILLLLYSEYWKIHYDILATFAMTTFLIPLFYLRFISKVHNKNDELSEILTTTSHDANHDVLTGLANRKMYKETIQRVLKKKEFFALMFIDLNKFKGINDTYGHHVGDEVLKEVSKRLVEHTSDKEFVARLGGDEFVIISRRKKVFLKKFLKILEDNVIGDHTVDEVTVPVELSIGISVYPEDSKGFSPDDHSIEILLGKYADDAMYAAKGKVGVHHVFYSEIK